MLNPEQTPQPIDLPPPPPLPPSPLASPQPKPWGAWPTLGLGAVILFVYFVVQSVVAVAMVLWRVFSNPDLSLTQLLNNLTTDGLLLSVATISSAIVGGLAIALFIRVKKGFSLAEYLRLTRISRRTLLTIGAVFFGLLIISLVIGYFFNQVGDSQFATETYQSSRWPALFAVAVVIFAPIFEEGFFRGFLFRGLKDSALGGFGTVVLTSLCWALLHIQYNGYGIGEIFVLGLAFGAVRLKTNSLTAPLLLHALWNLAAVVSVAVAT